MKRYAGFGVVLICVAGCFGLFALITWGLAGGDLFADVDYVLPRRRRRGEAGVVTYPAFVPIKASVLYGFAILLSGIAHIRGRLPLLVASSVVGVLGALWAAIDGVVFGRDTGSAVFAVLIAVIAIALALYVSIKTSRDGRRVTPHDPAAEFASLHPPAPGSPWGVHGAAAQPQAAQVPYPQATHPQAAPFSYPQAAPVSYPQAAQVPYPQAAPMHPAHPQIQVPPQGAGHLLPAHLSGAAPARRAHARPPLEPPR